MLSVTELTLVPSHNREIKIAPNASSFDYLVITFKNAGVSGQQAQAFLAWLQLGKGSPQATAIALGYERPSRFYTLTSKLLCKMRKPTLQLLAQDLEHRFKEAGLLNTNHDALRAKFLSKLGMNVRDVRGIDRPQKIIVRKRGIGLKESLREPTRIYSF